MAGSAWTNQAVVSPIVVVGGSGNNIGIFVYNGTPGAGNLIGSWSPSAGTDPYGNNYPLGFNATQGTFSGVVSAGGIVNTPIGGATVTGSDWQGGTMEEPVITFDVNGGQILVYSATSTTTTFTTAGNHNWTAPAGVTQVTAECWGGGGRGGQPTFAGGGGGGGGYGKVSNIPVTPANVYVAAVGAGSSSSAAGGDSTFTGDSGTAPVGNGGKSSTTNQPGEPGGGTGTVHFSGGEGGLGSSFKNNGGGGGGSSAGPSSTGKMGAGHSGSSGGAGGAAVSGGGKGGNGGNSGSSGSNGSAPGGGGGGQGYNGASPGNGAAGQVKLTYLSGSALIGSWAAVAGTDSFSNSFPEGLMVDAVNAPAVALNPSTGTGPETWHSLSLANSWGGTCLYRMVPHGSVQLQISIDSTSATAFQFGTMPTAYRPSSTMYIAAGSNGNVATGVGPFVQVTSAGAISMNGLHAFTTAATWVCGGSYPLSD